MDTPTHDCYTDDWQRTKPDRVVYLPVQPGGPHGDNEHLIIVEAPRSGDLLATWSTGTYECSPDYHTVFARSRDGGRTWGPPQVMPGTKDGPMLGGRWGGCIVSRSGRIYFFYNKCVGLWDASWTTDGALCCIVSDDDGHTWGAPVELSLARRTKYSHPDPRVPCGWIAWQPAIRDRNGKWLLGWTRWSSLSRYPAPRSGYHLDARSELMRFENLDDGPAPQELRISWLPEGDSISVPCPVEPEQSQGYSLAEEPSVVLLPDGRLFVVVRTRTGHVWYTVSDDDGRTWRQTEILRRGDGGPKMLHPKSPCPIYRLADGRYLLFFHNHDGTGYGAAGPHDMNARRPVFVSVGRFQPDAHQPIGFDEPRLLFDTDGVALGPGNGAVEGGRSWLALYGCLTEFGGQRTLWYPDRKHFLLGRVLTDEWLAASQDHG
jgi:hypothetical protein